MKRTTSATDDGAHTFPSANSIEIAIGPKKRRKSTSDHEDRLAKKRKEEKQKAASVAAVMERIGGRDFPTELLMNIIDFRLRSTVGRWDIDVTPQTKAAAWKSGGLAWPEALSLRARQTIQQAIADVFPKSVVVGTPLHFLYDYPLSIPRTFPSELHGSNSRVRNLVLNLDLSPPKKIGVLLEELRLATVGIERVVRSMPNLQTCVLIVQHERIIRSEEELTTEPHSLPPFRRRPTVGRKTLKIRAARLDLIDAFAKRGPGERRFLRVESHQKARGWVYKDGRIPKDCTVDVGPLIRVNERVVDGEVPVGGEDDPRSDAFRLMGQAYRFEREVSCRVRGHDQLRRSTNGDVEPRQSPEGQERV
jgi:hypothetical protein